MDSVFLGRQPAPPSVAPLWHHQQSNEHMEYHQYGIAAPPTHTITSPPTTPMTPGPITPVHQHIISGYTSLDHHNYQSLHATVPALSHSTWPPEYRIFAMCQELNCYSFQATFADKKIFWEQFYLEYFHEMSSLIIETDFGDGIKQYTLDGNLIIWYFKSIMESGISKYNLILGKISHLYQQHIQRIESQEVVQELDYELPYHTKVCAKGQIVLELTPEDKPRILSFFFRIQNCVELIPRFCTSMDNSSTNNLSCQGLPTTTKSLLVQLNRSIDRESPKIMPPLTIGTTSTSSSLNNHWESNHEQHLIVDMTPSMLTHMPLNDSMLPHSTTSPVSTSPTILKSGNTSSSNGSIVSSCNNIVDHKPAGIIKSTSPIRNIKKASQLVMVASEPALFSEDMVHGSDERKITRVANHGKQTPTTSLSTTPANSELPTPTIQMTNSLVWLEATPTSSNTDQWNVPHTTEQR